jgi:hypothetical protein
MQRAAFFCSFMISLQLSFNLQVQPPAFFLFQVKPAVFTLSSDAAGCLLFNFRCSLQLSFNLQERPAAIFSGAACCFLYRFRLELSFHIQVQPAAFFFFFMCRL